LAKITFHNSRSTNTFLLFKQTWIVTRKWKGQAIKIDNKGHTEYSCLQSLHKWYSYFWFLARLYEVYGELSYSPRRPRPNFRLKFWCSKIFFTLTLSFLKVSTSNFKYMFLIINHILCDKVHNSSTNIFRFISPWT